MIVESRKTVEVPMKKTIKTKPYSLLPMTTESNKTAMYCVKNSMLSFNSKPL